MSNLDQLIELWRQANQVLDSKRIAIFRLMSDSQQRELIESIKRELVKS